MSIFWCIVVGTAVGTPVDDLGALVLPLRGQVTSPSPESAANSDEREQIIELEKSRDEQLDVAQAHLNETVSMIESANSVTTASARIRLRKGLEAARGETLQKMERALVQALESEIGRLKSIEAAITSSETTAERSVQLRQVRRILAVADSPRSRELIAQRVAAYRHVITGLIEFLDAKYPAAAQQLGQATQIAPDLLLAYIYYGSFSLLIGDSKQARTAWHRALDLDPENEAIRRALQELDFSDPQ